MSTISKCSTPGCQQSQYKNGFCIDHFMKKSKENSSVNEPRKKGTGKNKVFCHYQQYIDCIPLLLKVQKTVIC